MALYVDHVTRVVQPQALDPRRSVVTAGDDSQQPCLEGVRAIALPQIGTWRREATRRSRSHGPPRSGPGRPKPYDGHVQGSDLARGERVASGDAGIVLSTQVVHQVQCTRHVRGVMVVEPGTHRSARLLSPDTDRAAARLYGFYNARVPSDCLGRDAHPWTGLSDCQARSQAKLACHVTMRLRAVTWATLAARQDAHDPLTACSMARLHRRYVHQPLMDRLLTT